jgi:alpha-ketoglutarate-dependent taurine dioxygenase
MNDLKDGEVMMVDLRVEKLAPSFGAEVHGLSPAGPLDAETRSELRSLFDRYGLLRFPGLKPDARFQTYLAEQLISDAPVDADSLFVEELHQVSNVEKVSAVPIGSLMFHSDTMWVEEGTKVISLYGKHVEPGAIPTTFISAAHAWNTLPDDLRKRIEGRFVVHCIDATDQRRNSVPDDVLVTDLQMHEELRLPISYRHPRTGQMLLYVCPQLTHHVEGLSYADSETLLDELFEHMYAEENVFTHEWKQGDLIVWDNLTLQHSRPDLRSDGAARTLRKTLVPTYLTGEDLPRPTVTYSRFGDARSRQPAA